MAEQWFILRDGKRHGPYSGADLKKYAASGHLLPIDLVVKDGMTNPVPAAKVKGLFPTVEPTPRPEHDDFVAATQQNQTPSRRRTPPPNQTKLYLILGGCGLLAVVVVIALLVLISGRKQNTANGPDVAKTGRETASPGRVAGEGKEASPPEVKVDLPDFSKVDYSFDTSKVDYTKGPQGQKLETQTLDGGQKIWQQYQGPDGKYLFHGKVGQTVRGVKVLENYFFAGYQHGQQTEWYSNGQMKFVGVMKEGKKHGKWQHWHDNGKPQKEEFFLNGVKHGPENEWLKDGVKKSETTFVDGIEHGRLTMWWENGKKSTEIHIRKGVRHGSATWWEMSGAVSMRLTFRDGKTSFDPTSGSIEDFATANEAIFGGTRRQSLQVAFDTYGKPASGFAEVANLKNETQKWVYRCTDGEATLRCTVVRNDFWKEPRMVDIWEVKKR
jgi:antitoxin component YwqK of YwqJK toxin-antitoxin module